MIPPKCRRQALHNGHVKESLNFELNENLLSAWDAVATGAALDAGDATCICNIVLADHNTRIAICMERRVVDTASLALGAETLVIDSANNMLSISESGETFLDAVAKKISVGYSLEPEMPSLLANLIGETVINLVARKRPPQISMRLLDTEPLVSAYNIDKFIVSNCSKQSRMSDLIFAGICDSILERQYPLETRQCPSDDELITATGNIELSYDDENHRHVLIVQQIVLGGIEYGVTSKEAD